MTDKTNHNMTNFERWWMSQSQNSGMMSRFMARQGWESALDKTIKEIDSLSDNPNKYHYRSSEVFCVAHNACVDHIFKCFAEGKYPQI